MEKQWSENLEYNRRSEEHSCNTRGKSFNAKSKLNRHESIHTGEKPHKCDICEKTFSDSTTLAYHKKIHIGKHLNGIPVKRLSLLVVA